MNFFINWALRQALGSKRGGDLVNALGPWLPQITEAIIPDLQKKLDVQKAKVNTYLVKYVNSPNFVVASLANEIETQVNTLKL